VLLVEAGSRLYHPAVVVMLTSITMLHHVLM
jgi:hypothetical protein